jgi:filamentous hemagglutinin
VDLDILCGSDNKRCKTNDDGSLALSEGLVQFVPSQAKGMSLTEFLETDEGKKAIGPTGGVQGMVGSLFGKEYEPGSWQDKLVEIFSGSHDTFGGSISGLYDEQGNIKRGMSEVERTAYDVWSGVAVPIAAPFAMSELLPPEVWNAISVLIKAAK